jgi:hypothetical protein
MGCNSSAAICELSMSALPAACSEAPAVSKITIATRLLGAMPNPWMSSNRWPSVNAPTLMLVPSISQTDGNGTLGLLPCAASERSSGLT